MLVKDFRMRGMDLRSSDIRRSPEFASDIINMEPDSSGEWIKRRGFDNEINIPNTVDTDEYTRGDEKITLTTTGLVKSDGAVSTAINLGGSAPASGWSVKASWAEYNGVLYWTDPAGNTDLYKYDGYMTYKAGMPKFADSGSINGAGAPTYYRVAYYFIDMQGQVHWGDYKQFPVLLDSGTMNVTNLNGTEFHSKHGSTSGIVQTIDAGNLVLNVIVGHNYIAGDWVRSLSDTAGNGFKPLQVESVDILGNTITFTAASVGADAFTYSPPERIERRLYARVWSSLDEDFGYTTSADVLCNTSLTFVPITPAAHVATNTPMEDEYDTIKLKGLPPRTKYITVYNNVMVAINRTVTNNILGTISDIKPRDKDSFFWSDLGIGSTVETFAPDDYDTLGKTDEGELTGGFANSDSLIIFKNKQIYYINGILTGRLFRARSASTSKIGCVSHKSIQEFDGGCVFTSSRGIYFARNGQTPIEMSDIVEKYFTEDTTGLDFTTSIAILDEKDEKYYIYTESATSESNDSVLCYDYQYKDWFKYNGISARGGFKMIGNDMFFSNSAGDILKRFPTRLDDALAISASYSSGWWNMGTPSLKKKFTNLVLTSTAALKWLATIKTQINWDATTAITDDSIQMDTDIPVDNRKLSMGKAYAIRFIIENNVASEEMFVSGYEFEWEYGQISPKGSE